MNEKNRNLAIRVVSSLLLLPIVLFLLWRGPASTAVVMAIAAVGVTAELYGMVGLPLRHVAGLWGMAAAGAMPWFALQLPDRWPWLLALLVFSPIVALGALTLAPPGGDLRRGAELSGFAALGPAHVGLSLASIVLLHELPGESGFGWIFVLLAVTWGNDTGAYFAGRFFGRHKLHERVSPKKTWEGFWGGMVTATLLAIVVGFTPLLPELRVEDAIVLGVVAGLLGPLGDLAESMLKRAFGAKDSGRIIPGHGGLYDRIDALLFNAPWVVVYAYWLRGTI